MRDSQRPEPTSDLDTPEEIAELVRRFYADVAQDDLLGPMFNDVAQVDWSEHLPKLTAFWCRALLGMPGYQGNPFRAHLLIHAQSEFTAAHFERWLNLFQADEHVMSALRAGADGFLLKDTAPAEIVDAVRHVAAGAAMLSPSVTRTLLAHLDDDETADRRRLAAERLKSLTDREREVAAAVGSGASNAEVAASLFMSEATVKAHVSRLLTKLSVTNRVQIAILVHDAQS